MGSRQTENETSPSAAFMTPRVGGTKESQRTLANQTVERKQSVPDNVEYSEKHGDKYKIFQSKNEMPPENAADAIAKVQNWMHQHAYDDIRIADSIVNEHSTSRESLPPSRGNDERDSREKSETNYSSADSLPKKKNYQKRDYCVKGEEEYEFNTLPIKTDGKVDDDKFRLFVQTVFLETMKITCPLEISPLDTYKNHHVAYVYCQLNKKAMAWRLLFSDLNTPTASLSVNSTRCNIICPHEEQNVSSNENAGE